MEHQLNCEIVRDLLPSYADGLTTDTTNQAVEAHLADCPDCAEALRRMREPAEPDVPPAAEVDFLKKVRRRTSRVGMICGIVMMVIGMLLIFARVFLLGSAATAADANFTISVEGHTVYVSGNLVSSAAGMARVVFEESAGIVNIRIYTAPHSFVSRNSFHAEYTAQSDCVGMVRCDGLILWENGVQISPMASQLYAALNPFMGDMPANGRIANILGVSDQLGSYTNVLHSTEPYSWTLCLDDLIARDEERTAREIMTADAYVMLAAVGNLDRVTWEYRTDAGTREYTVTAADAAAYVGGDIKACAESASALQALLERLSIKWAGVRETLQETGEFYLKITDYSDDKLYGLAMNYYLDGRLLGTRVGGNADGTKLKKGDALTFTFIPDDFPEGTVAADLSGFSFDLFAVDGAGNQTLIRENVPVAAKYAWCWDFSLTGKFDAGFTLNAG